MNHMKIVLNGTERDVEELLATYGPGEGSVRQIATYCVLIKRELTSAKSELKCSRSEVMGLRRQLKLAEDQANAKHQQLEEAFKEMTALQAQCVKLTVSPR